MKNKKGFTLVELLAVIVIIAVVATIGYTGTDAIKRKINKSVFEKNLNQIMIAAEKYGTDNRELIEASAEDMTINGSARMVAIVSLWQLIYDRYEEPIDTVSYKSLNAEQKKLCVKVKKSETDSNKILCYSINHYEDQTSINDLKIAVYYANNSHSKVKACIPTTGSYSNNLLLLNDDSKAKFKDLNIYCTENRFAS